MLEFLFLSLPVAVAYGWVMGRNSLRKTQRKQSSILSKHYYKGLNFLLSDQPDKAVDTFIKMMSVNNDTIETHIAMGNFFRHRGELDRAIRVHQNLVSREEINAQQQANALVELGTDYLLAGFLERAEGVFIQLLENEDHFLSAQKKLFGIYQVTKEWHKAIELASRSLKITPKDTVLKQLLSHFYCEQAEIYLDEKQDKQARELLMQAIDIAPDEVRAYLLMARLCLAAQEYDHAFNYLSKIAEHNPDWLSETIPLLKTWATETNNWQSFDKLLASRWEHCASAYIAKSELIEQQVSLEQASQLLVEQLDKHPTMQGFVALMDNYRKQIADESSRKSIANLQSLLSKQILQRPKYRCHSCGFSGRRLHWLCPACKKWSVLKPIKGLDGE